MHSQADAFRVAVAQLRDASWNSATRGTPVVLGFGLLLRECRRAQDYEKDDENGENMVPLFFSNSRLGIERMEEVLAAVETVVAQRQKIEELAREVEKPEEKMLDDETVKVGEAGRLEMQEGEKESEEKKKDDGKKEMKTLKMTVEVPRMPMKTLLKQSAEDPVMSEPTEGTTEDQEDELVDEYQRPGPSKKPTKDSPAKNTRSKRIRVMTKRAQGQV